MSESLLILPRSKGLSSKVSHRERCFVLPLGFSSGQGKQTSLAILRPKEPTRAYGDHTKMEARTTWVWRDSLDGELTLRSASGQAATILAYVGSSPRPFIAIAERATTAWFCGETTEAGPFFFSETPFPGYHSSSCVCRETVPIWARGPWPGPPARRPAPSPGRPAGFPGPDTIC